MAEVKTSGKRHVVDLSANERYRLETMIQNGKHSARLLRKAGILLKADTQVVPLRGSISEPLENIGHSLTSFYSHAIMEKYCGNHSEHIGHDLCLDQRSLNCVRKDSVSAQPATASS